MGFFLTTYHGQMHCGGAAFSSAYELILFKYNASPSSYCEFPYTTLNVYLYCHDSIEVSVLIDVSGYCVLTPLNELTSFHITTFCGLNDLILLSPCIFAS